jgi:hypothetical protein
MLPFVSVTTVGTESSEASSALAGAAQGLTSK